MKYTGPQWALLLTEYIQSSSPAVSLFVVAMSLSGYMLDLSQLTGDCVVEFTDEKIELDSKSCQLELTANTLAAMMLLNENTAKQVSEAHEADEKAASINSIFIDSSPEVEGQNGYLSCLNTSKPSSTTFQRSSLEKYLVERNESGQTAPFPPTSATTPNLPKITTLLLSNSSTLNCNEHLIANPSKTVLQKLSPTIAMETRNTQTVIDDLKRQLHGTTMLQSRRGQSSVLNCSISGDNQQLSSLVRLTEKLGEDEEDDEDNEDDELETQQSTKARDISERKRRLNAIADTYSEEKIQMDIKKGTRANVIDEEQSARWLVNETEKRQIISSPRDYQLELFERAKMKNVIAVLDTGMLRYKATNEYHTNTSRVWENLDRSTSPSPHL